MNDEERRQKQREYNRRFYERRPDYQKEYYARNKERIRRRDVEKHGGEEGLREYNRAKQRASRGRRKPRH